MSFQMRAQPLQGVGRPVIQDRLMRLGDVRNVARKMYRFSPRHACLARLAHSFERPGKAAMICRIAWVTLYLGECAASGRHRIPIEQSLERLLVLFRAPIFHPTVS